MAGKRANSFKVALETLKAELRGGIHAAGARLTATEIAERLDLSPTPVARRCRAWRARDCCRTGGARGSSCPA